MADRVAPGLPADWLNGWLAAVGATILVPGLRLAWTDDGVPLARFVHEDGEDLGTRLARHLPTVEALRDLVIAGLSQNTSVAAYRQAAAGARDRQDPTLGVLCTDVGHGASKGAIPTGPFNVGAPRGETLFDRLEACRAWLDRRGDVPAQIDATLDGRGSRVGTNGLGFDYRRIAASVPGEGAKWADPVVECLCFFGLLIHPVGWDGKGIRQRGWTAKPTQRHSFSWPVWREPLDQWAIDALLDEVYTTATPAPSRSSSSAQGAIDARLARLGVTGMYGTVWFRGSGASDTTRGYASERLA